MRTTPTIPTVTAAVTPCDEDAVVVRAEMYGNKGAVTAAGSPAYIHVPVARSSPILEDSSAACAHDGAASAAGAVSEVAPARVRFNAAEKAVVFGVGLVFGCATKNGKDLINVVQKTVLPDLARMQAHGGYREHMRHLAADVVITLYTKRLKQLRKKVTIVKGTENDDHGPRAAFRPGGTEGDGNQVQYQSVLDFRFDRTKRVSGSGESAEARKKRKREENESKAVIQSKRREYFAEQARKAQERKDARDAAKAVADQHFVQRLDSLSRSGAITANMQATALSTNVRTNFKIFGAAPPAMLPVPDMHLPSPAGPVALAHPAPPAPVQLSHSTPQGGPFSSAANGDDDSD